MTKHLEEYCKTNNIDKEDIICEISGRPASLGGVDIHHLRARGMGGRPLKDLDTRENLMAASRSLHDFIESNPKYFWWFQLVHYSYMITRKPYHENPCSFDDPIFQEIVEYLKKIQQ